MSVDSSGNDGSRNGLFRADFNLDSYLRDRSPEDLKILTITNAVAKHSAAMEDIVIEGDTGYDEVVLCNVLGESLSTNEALLRYSSQLVLRPSGLIVAMNSAGPKRYGLPKSQLSEQNLEELAHVGAGFHSRELFDRCQGAWDRPLKEGEARWTHHHGFVDVLRPIVQAPA